MSITQTTLMTTYTLPSCTCSLRLMFVAMHIHSTCAWPPSPPSPSPQPHPTPSPLLPSSLVHNAAPICLSAQYPSCQLDILLRPCAPITAIPLPGSAPQWLACFAISPAAMYTMMGHGMMCRSRDRPPMCGSPWRPPQTSTGTQTGAHSLMPNLFLWSAQLIQLCSLKRSQRT